ncbi:uncharacterized protein LOC108676374 [Hyalella azteca]|uniref:Uncharacterized protein LOC108676374 n=1 Tax=Hyalella azteca TaxID=294128 RepID=A0A8B7P1G7_HYAAZ|nr:uncharacterized protein LOC108676374 [Hyalella azteca]
MKSSAVLLLFVCAALLLQLASTHNNDSTSIGTTTQAGEHGPEGRAPGKDKPSVGVTEEGSKSPHVTVTDEGIPKSNVGVHDELKIESSFRKVNAPPSARVADESSKQFTLKDTEKNIEHVLGRLADEDTRQSPQTRTPDEDSSQPHRTSGEDEGNKVRFFFGGYSTLTHTIVSFSTSTTPVTCFSGYVLDAGAVPICTGRRKRKREVLNFDRESDASEVTIDSSQDSEIESGGDFEDDSKKFFTIWTKVLTTTTLTTFVENAATTLSLEYYCSAGNLDIPLIGC